MYIFGPASVESDNPNECVPCKQHGDTKDGKEGTNLVSMILMDADAVLLSEVCEIGTNPPPVAPFPTANTENEGI